VSIFFICLNKGSFATASCTVCKIKVGSEFIREKIFNQEIPYCEKCKVNNESDRTQSEEDAASSSSTSTGSFNSRAGILKPDIVFFGEGLNDLFIYLFYSFSLQSATIKNFK